MKTKTDNKWKEVSSYILVVLAAAVLALFINKKLLVNAKVPSGSMETTVMTGDRLIINRLAYRKKEPERGDIIMFLYPDDETQDYLKRIIGLPGETLEIRDGLVYINESKEPLAEEYLDEEMEGDYGPVEIPEGAYFVMGDNRDDSWDSRDWEKPFVYREKIVGKAVFRYYPKPGVLK